MKMNQSTVEIDRNDMLERTSYSIKATGLSFQILSSGLYKDKIKAIIRELSCNAFDAHVSAGNEKKPFDVHLPTMLEPHFLIRDYGTGLSKQDCQTILPRFFESTKTESNDLIGAMGLGSKSPFCYVESYTITSYFNGMKYIFNSLIAEDGAPTLELMDEQATTEPNGLEISLPSKQNDIQVWKDRAEMVFQWFEVKPNMTGAPINLKEPSYLFEGTGWKLRQFQQNNPYRNPYHNRGFHDQSAESSAIALMGKIAYPISFDALKGHLDDLQLSLLRFPLEIRFDIGELEFAASREELSYKPDTIAAIKKRIDLVLSEVPRQTQDKFDKANSLWEAKHLVSELFNSNNALSQIISHIARNKNYAFKYNGKEINSCDSTIEFKNFAGLTFKQVGTHEMCRPVHMDDLIKKQNDYMTSHKVTYDKLQDHNKTYRMSQTPNILFFVNDLKIGPGKRLTQFAEKWYSQASAHRYHSPIGIQGIYLVEGPQNVVDAFFKEIGDPPVHKVSELPIPEKAQPKKKHQYRLWEQSYSYWKDVHEELPDQKEVVYYAYVARDVAVGGTYSWDVNSFRKLINALHTVDVFDKTIKIVGLNKLEFDKQEARTDSKWVRIDKMTDELFAKIMANTKLIDRLVRLKSIEFIKRDWSLNNMMTNLSATMQSFDSTRPMYQYLEKFRECNQNSRDLHSKMATFFELVEVLQKSSQLNSIPTMSSDWNNTLDVYPMLKYINIHYMDKFTDVAEYIKLIDKVAK